MYVREGTGFASRCLCVVLAIGVVAPAAAQSPKAAGLTVYVSNEGSRTVDVVDALAGRVIASIPVGERRRRDRRAHGARRGEASQLHRSRAVRHHARWPPALRGGVDLSEDGRWLVVANGVSNSISVVDVREARVVREIPVGRLPWGVAIGP